MSCQITEPQQWGRSGSICIPRAPVLARVGLLFVVQYLDLFSFGRLPGEVIFDVEFLFAVLGAPTCATI